MEGPVNKENGIPGFKFRLATYWLENVIQYLTFLNPFHNLVTEKSENTCSTTLHVHYKDQIRL
jgi:hypothetical protein